jgi:uncharacterized membrane protein YgdD (TMEM256/DUF423 family)
MTLQPTAKSSLVTGALLLGVAVLIGAFGAHGLKNMVEAEKLVTFETGVRYHFYHAFGLLFLGVLKQVLPDLKVQVSFWAFLCGILLFSFNCYFYVLSNVKVFAMVVPLGGVLFVLGWFVLAARILKLR